MSTWKLPPNLPIDSARHVRPPASPLVEATIDLVKEAVRKRFAESGMTWEEFVFAGSDKLLTVEDMRAVEAKILASGHRFDWSARISVSERPEIYKSAAGVTDDGAGFAHPDAPTGEPDAAGRALRGVGDNVVRHKQDASGFALYVRSNERVLELLSNGVPPGAIAIIDDSGGTLTAPIIDRFAGVICAGGTVRSHLGILTREYNIPCLMNAKVTGIREGERVVMEASADAKTTEDYQQGIDRTARVWVMTEAGQ